MLFTKATRTFICIIFQVLERKKKWALVLIYICDLKQLSFPQSSWQIKTLIMSDDADGWNRERMSKHLPLGIIDVNSPKTPLGSPVQQARFLPLVTPEADVLV